MPEIFLPLKFQLPVDSPIEDEITVAEVLKSNRYVTACFGKWDLAKHSKSDFFLDLFPTRQGFDYFRNADQQ